MPSPVGALKPGGVGEKHLFFSLYSDFLPVPSIGQNGDRLVSKTFFLNFFFIFYFYFYFYFYCYSITDVCLFLPIFKWLKKQTNSVLEFANTHRAHHGQFHHTCDVTALEWRRVAHNWFLQGGVNKLQHTTALNRDKSQPPGACGNNVWQVLLRNLKWKGWFYQPTSWKGDKWHGNRIELYVHHQWGNKHEFYPWVRAGGGKIDCPVQGYRSGVTWQTWGTPRCLRIQRTSLSGQMDKIKTKTSSESWEGQSKPTKAFSREREYWISAKPRKPNAKSE